MSCPESHELQLKAITAVIAITDNLLGQAQITELECCTSLGIKCPKDTSTMPMYHFKPSLVTN